MCCHDNMCRYAQLYQSVSADLRTAVDELVRMMDGMVHFNSLSVVVSYSSYRVHVSHSPIRIGIEIYHPRSYLANFQWDKSTLATSHVSYQE